MDFLVIILNTVTFTSFVSLGTHIFVGKSLIAFQLPLHSPRLIMNGKKLSSVVFKLMKVGLIIHDPLCYDTLLVAKGSLKLNTAINICLISHNIILYYS